MAILTGLGASAALSVGLVACGSGSGSTGGAKGGSITIAQAGQPDFLDPALSYTIHGWEPMAVVYTPLVTYKREEGEAGSELIPGLAEQLPKVSADGKTYELTLRKGLRYSDGTPVKASDFEHTIKRVLNLESGGMSYYADIEGAAAYVSGGNAEADISGIDTDDRTGEITIELTNRRADFGNALAMNFAGLVPGETPFENMTKDPPPGVGAYMFTKSVPNREFVMERNPRYSEDMAPGVPEAKIDTVTTKIVPNVVQQTQEVIDNKIDFMQEPPAPDLKAEVLERFGPEGREEQRYEEFPTLSTYWFFLNTRVAPFDDQKVREAVNIGIDRSGIARLYAGEMEPGCSFLPPAMPGYTEEIDVSACPWGDPNQPPDLERAKQLIEEAGAEGAKVTVWGDNVETTPKVTQAYTDMLNEIGLDAEPKIVDSSVYFQTIGNQKTEAQTGFLNFFADFTHPLNFFTIMESSSIQPTNNQNFSNVSDPRVDGDVKKLGEEPELPAVTDGWEELNDYVVERAYIVPFGHRNLTTFVSDRIDFENCTVVSPIFYNDYSQFCLKEGG